MAKKHIPRSLIVLGLCLALGAVGTYIFITWANQPVEQTISTTPPSNVTPNTIHKTVRTKQFTTLVDENFREQTTENPKQPDLTQTLLHDTRGTSEQIGITVNRLPAGGISEVADYNLRVTMPDTYKPYGGLQLARDGKVFHKTDGSELSFFMENGDRYASITVSNHDIATLEELLKTTVDNWQWL